MKKTYHPIKTVEMSMAQPDSADLKQAEQTEEQAQAKANLHYLVEFFENPSIFDTPAQQSQYDAEAQKLKTYLEDNKITQLNFQTLATLVKLTKSHESESSKMLAYIGMGILLGLVLIGAGSVLLSLGFSVGSMEDPTPGLGLRMGGGALLLPGMLCLVVSVITGGFQYADYNSDQKNKHFQSIVSATSADTKGLNGPRLFTTPITAPGTPLPVTVLSSPTATVSTTTTPEPLTPTSPGLAST